ncbi:Smr/MutS family protein [Azospirillum halopraeferens]|uniref:Smr/MutS family protein n=1 Tax=Azospirillum halopraeferens TaxID=34010 RepID=UPI0003FF8789|nr:Smr/MutS family protein [Azospirillum halopraeferens]
MTRKRTLSEEERRLWRIAMRDAAPLPGRTLAEEMTSAPPQPQPEPAAPVPVPAPAVPAPARRAAPALRPLRAGELADMDRRSADRLRKGRMEIDGRIDLHGMTQDQAHGALAAFIHRCRHEGRRCVLVITGKGNFSPDGGILRRVVPRWLAEPALRPLILAVQAAQPRHGGDGALYVLIRRRRDAGP